MDKSIEKELFFNEQASRETHGEGGKDFGKNLSGWGTTLVAQWLSLNCPNAGALGLIPGQGTRSHTQQLKIQTPQLRSIAAK